ncbi:Rv3235 family protein [Streptomyces chartreusis]|uniref:Rv3235 family protein n=1 Tax=Streptomyces chartreusis TaxID=1969 RepID=UPI00365E2CE6
MHKVMTRTQHRPGTRPPTRRDTRRPADSPPRTPAGSSPRTPADSPPRTPSGGTPRTASPGDRPPGSLGTRGSRTRTGPTDTRPQTAPGSTPRVPAPRAPRLPARPGTRVATPPASHAPTPHAARLPATDGLRAPRGLPAAGGLPATDTSPPRPVVPQPRPTDVFADRLLLVLSGQRPVHSMLRHTAGRAYDELAWLAERGPLRTRGTRPVVRDIGYFEPRAGAIEAFARIAAGDQLRAMAFRLEQGNDLRWRCTAVELGGPRKPRADDD